jgi:hypothetical protein
MMRKTIKMADIAQAEFDGPTHIDGSDLFRASGLFDIRLTWDADGPEMGVMGPNGEGLCVLEEDGTEMDPEEVQALIWERLETFDEVIERLAGPLPDL